MRMACERKSGFEDTATARLAAWVNRAVGWAGWSVATNRKPSAADAEKNEAAAFDASTNFCQASAFLALRSAAAALAIITSSSDPRPASSEACWSERIFSATRSDSPQYSLCSWAKRRFQ